MNTSIFMRPVFKLSIPVLLLLSIGFVSKSHAACDCGSVDESQPCTGRNVTVRVSESRTVTFNWSFNSGGSDALCGQFANGDYWIAPRTGQSSVTITTLTTSGSGPVTLDSNPQLESMGLLSSSNTYGNYNAAESLASSLPRSFGSSVSLVAAVQRNESAHGNCGTKAIVGNCADAYNVLTVLSSVPPKNGSATLRPNIDDAEKDLLSFDDFDLTRLPSKSFFTGTDAAGLERIRQRWSHSTEVLAVKSFRGDTFSEGGRAFRASLLVDDYGGGVVQAWHDDLMVLFSSSNTLTQKRPALAAMLVYGKDLYHAIYNGTTRTRNWGSGAGQSLGKFPPAAFFAALAKSTTYANVLRNTSTTLLGYEDIRGPHELDQINIGKNGPVWGDYPDLMSDTDVGAYWGSMLKSQCFAGATGTCDTGIGKKTSRDPYGYIDGPPNLPGTNYMGVSTGPMRSLVATMFLIPRMCEIVNYQPLVEYIDRIHSHGIQAGNDPCAPPDPREDPDTCDPYRGGEGCRYYGLNNTGVATWGPDPNAAGQCIKNRAGQNGRFPARDGERLTYGYTSNQVERNWDQIRGTDATCGDGAVPDQSPPRAPGQISGRQIQ